MKMELGAQTFTVRDYMQTTWDFREAMKRIAEIGYTCVQLSAVGNVPVQAQRDICDEFGLKIVLTHTNPDRMIADPEGVIRDHDILGCDYIGIGMMNPKYQRAEWIDQFAKDFTTPAKKMRDAGKLLMYHNHNLEWTRLRDGRRIAEIRPDKPILRAFRHRPQTVEIPGVGQLVQIQDLYSRPAQRQLDKVAADEAGAAGNQNFLHCF